MPRLAEKYVANDAMLGVGGGGANAAMALQRLGGQALLAGRMGDDLLAGLVLEKLLDEQVNCHRVKRIKHVRSAVSSIYIDAQGERQIVNFRGDVSNMSIASLSSSDVQKPAADRDAFAEGWLEMVGIEQCKAVLVDTRWEAGALAALKLARTLGLPAVVDAEAPTSIKAMALATHIAFSRQGLREYAGTADVRTGLQRARDQFDNWVCVTDGSEGVYYLASGQLERMATPTVKAVDTLGAGDVWHAAFTLELAQGHAELAAITYANAAAALKCTRFGGASAAPGYLDVEAFLRS